MNELKLIGVILLTIPCYLFQGATKGYILNIHILKVNSKADAVCSQTDPWHYIITLLIIRAMHFTLIKVPL
jgi:hypothetical protein